MNERLVPIPSKARFLEELRRILGRDDIDDDTGFDELAPDSIVLMEIVTFVAESAPAIEPADVLQCGTIRGLYRFIALDAVERDLPA